MMHMYGLGAITAQEAAFIITQWYLAIGRQPDAAGLKYWVDKAVAGEDMNNLRREWLVAAEQVLAQERLAAQQAALNKPVVQQTVPQPVAAPTPIQQSTSTESSSFTDIIKSLVSNQQSPASQSLAPPSMQVSVSSPAMPAMDAPTDAPQPAQSGMNWKWIVGGLAAAFLFLKKR